MNSWDSTLICSLLFQLVAWLRKRQRCRICRAHPASFVLSPEESIELYVFAIQLIFKCQEPFVVRCSYSSRFFFEIFEKSLQQVAQSLVLFKALKKTLKTLETWSIRRKKIETFRTLSKLFRITIKKKNKQQKKNAFV